MVLSVTDSVFLGISCDNSGKHTELSVHTFRNQSFGRCSQHALLFDLPSEQPSFVLACNASVSKDATRVQSIQRSRLWLAQNVKRNSTNIKLIRVVYTNYRLSSINVEIAARDRQQNGSSHATATKCMLFANHRVKKEKEQKRLNTCHNNAHPINIIALLESFYLVY